LSNRGKREIRGKNSVAQIGNLLFRRLAASGRLRLIELEISRGGFKTTRGGLPIRDTADCQSALRFSFRV